MAFTCNCVTPSFIGDSVWDTILRGSSRQKAPGLKATEEDVGEQLRRQRKGVLSPLLINNLTLVLSMDQVDTNKMTKNPELWRDRAARIYRS